MIWFLGDVHGHFEHIERAIDAATVKPMAVVFLGDLEAPIPLPECCAGIAASGVDWFWIIGNHDTDSAENFAYLSDPMSMDRNIDGKVVVIDGLRVAGLGGVFRGEVWHPELHGGEPFHRNPVSYERAIWSNRNMKQRLSKIDLLRRDVSAHGRSGTSQMDQARIGKLLRYRSTIWPDNYHALAKQRADILVTHEAPSCHCHGFIEIDRLAKVMGVRQVFHGHHHDALDYSAHWYSLGFQAFGIGFCGISDQNGDVIVTRDS